MESKISSREEVEEILKGLGEQLSEPVQFLVIGGAAMLEYGLKDVTKDIDLVCRDAAGKARLLEAAKSLGFEMFGPEKRHARLGLDRVAVKGGHTLDIFAGRISYDFGLSESYVAKWEDDPSPRKGGDEVCGSGGHLQSQADRQPAKRSRGLHLSGLSEDGF